MTNKCEKCGQCGEKEKVPIGRAKLQDGTLVPYYSKEDLARISKENREAGNPVVGTIVRREK